MRRRAPRHDLHLLLTIFTVGFWGPCWIITIIAAAWEPWRCRECKQPQPDEPKAPEPAIESAFGLAHEQAD